MSRNHLKTPTSRCRAGLGRADITPPVGTYHRFWGAAKHDRATGIHRRLTASALILEPAADSADRHVIFTLDHCLLRPPDMEQLRAAVAQSCALNPAQLTFTFSHTHSGGNVARGRADLPGGDSIEPYLDSLPQKLAAVFQQAADSLQSVTMTYAAASCSMGHNRDFRDDENDLYVCGFNPEVPAGLPVGVVRLTGDDGRLLATVVSYPCHPTTLAWDNTLLSPDYVGALRETVEAATNVPCLFLLAPCGDTGPRHGFTGDVEVADRNGRQLAFAALSALESMPPPAADYHYAGPVISGATVGCWEYRPHDEPRRAETARFRHRRWSLPLAYREDLPTLEEIQDRLQTHLQEEQSATEHRDEQRARDARALAERCRRSLERLRPLPTGAEYPYELALWQLGDAFWVAVEGEPYYALQEQLARRFPDNPVIVITLSEGSRCSYLPRREDYDKPLYQVAVALLQPGSLEQITDELVTQIQSWLDQ